MKGKVFSWITSLDTAFLCFFMFFFFLPNFSFFQLKKRKNMQNVAKKLVKQMWCKAQICWSKYTTEMAGEMVVTIKDLN